MAMVAVLRIVEWYQWVWCMSRISFSRFGHMRSLGAHILICGVGNTYEKGASVNGLLRNMAAIGIRVSMRDLGRRRGEYRHDHNLIIVNYRLSAIQQRCTLAHELGHAHYCDTEVTEAIEHRATWWAAGHLISRGDYARAEAVVGPAPRLIARELGVTPEFVKAFQERLFLAPAINPREQTETA